jgi:hypothetical protein
MKLKGVLPAGAGLLVALCVSGCGAVLEATRDTPVNLDHVAVGESRVNVMADLGAPLSSVKNGTNDCDVYKLCTEGPGAAGKGAIAAGEVVADIFTFGLTELIFTPVEAATRGCLHTVMACYGPDNKLASINVSEEPATAAGTPTQAAAANPAAADSGPAKPVQRQPGHGN